MLSTQTEALVEAKEEIHKLRADAEREARERRSELQQFERRLMQKEEALDRKSDALEKKESSLHQKEREAEQLRREIETTLNAQRQELERLSGLSSEEARELILKTVEAEIRHETAMMIRDIEAEAREEADKRARNIIALAIQRTAADHVAETTVSVVNLPNDDMKGRIIGKEGRNIRALETLTGIELIIDDTPEANSSGFDPVPGNSHSLRSSLVMDPIIRPALRDGGKARE